MDHAPDRLTEADAERARERRLVAMHLQAIEDNPLDSADVAMFEMFEREGWSPDRRRAYIRDQAAKAHAAVAAE
ncbi:hypothetical protein [Bosea sp. R86505]|uniref:hypothetical protein n=1 Tax=Bosea sp. R86505 TaxID=3101710 RepID=UPI00366C89C7